MKRPSYLSPSAIGVFEEDVSKYYVRYLTETPLPREPQTQPMAIGSAFDAYVKAYLHEGLFGAGVDPKFEFETLFEAQVETELRDWARANGKYVFEQYKQSGCLGDLMLELEGAIGPPRFEFDISGVVNGYRQGVAGVIGEVVLLGKPDASFTSKDGVHVILDFKVNGYCSKWPKSPDQYYFRMRSAGRRYHGQHPKCIEGMFQGMKINVACGLDTVNANWAQQLAIYGWLLGEPVGAEFVTVIHQIVCSPSRAGLPSIRIAEHINLLSPAFQQKVFDKACEIWEIVHSDHIFRNMTKEESLARCALLDGLGVDRGGDSLEKWIDEMALPRKR